MMMWVVFAAWREDDKALWNSHWVARQTLRRIQEPANVLEREAAVREALESALREPAVEGLALFGHGCPHAAFGSDRCEALDARNLELVKDKWVHAFACLTGEELALSATSAEIFVGYNTSLVVEWSVEDLPPELRELLAKLVTVTTAALFEGVRDKKELQRRAENAADDVALWLNENMPEGSLGVGVLTDQLVTRMVVGGALALVRTIQES